jgi:hypothetical protein
MFRILEDYNTYPPSVKKAIVFTVLAWGWFYVIMLTMQKVLENYAISRREVMIGVCIIVLLASMKNWARMICLLGNVMSVIYHAFFMFALLKHKMIVTFMGIDIVLLILSSYYLFIKPTSDFFKQYNLKTEAQEGDHASR